ncbi:MAG: chromosome segregation protein SMC [FCB group bacterium]|nr:chromosome segregation protein SMC [FCB group bacterium]
MYISELKIQGFKSFANKEVLHFGEGITAIVGPNGCGKTNIVDAIRWVLGEQKYSVLRSGKMEDVIFNGAKGLKPLSVSEVYLTVHNNRGKLPVEYTDIEVGRRLYRNGESEYFLNRTPCRLKDIQNLFVDTGMGADAYSVIELKMIEQILSEAGDERKRMFEEAAGINKYKSQRRSAFRKFEATKQDLERINDIITEVESKVRSLNLQLKRFKRHAKLKEKLKEKEIALATIQILKYNALAEPLRLKIKEFRHLRESKTAEEDVREAELLNLQKTYQEYEKELTSLQSALDELENEREQVRQNVLVWTEQIRSAVNAVNRLTLERTTNQSKLTQLENHIKDYSEEIRLLEPRIDEKLQAYKAKREEFGQLEEAYRKAQAEVEHIRALRWEEQKKVADQQALIDRTNSLIQEKRERIKHLADKLEVLESNQADYSDEQKVLEAKKKQILAELDDRKKHLSEQEQVLSTLQKKRHELTLEHHSALTQVESLESQLQFYRELVSTREGYPEGVRHILENQDHYPGILGTVADLFHVDEEYRLAMDSGLADRAHYLVSVDRLTALKTLAKARDEQTGKLTIIPLKEISAVSPRLKPLPSSSAVIGRASDLITADQTLKPLVDYLLGNLIVVEDLHIALQDAQLKGWNLVDLKGTYAGTDFILKYHPESDHGSIIGRLQKIEKLDREIDQLVDQSQRIKNDLESLDQEIIQKETVIEQSSLQVEALLDEQSGVETEIIRNHYRQSQALEAIQEITHELTEQRKQLHQLTDSTDILVPKLQEAKNRFDILTEKVKEATQALETARNERDAFNQQVQDIRIELLNLENQRDNLQFQLRTAEETIKELKKRRHEIDDEIETLEAKKVSLETQISDGNTALEKVRGKITHQRSVIELKRESYSSTYQAIEELQEKIRSEQKNRERILEELKQHELQIAEYEQRIKLIQERIRDRYEVSVAIPKKKDEIHAVSELGDEDDLEMEIQRIERALESIGPINMAVQAEYEEENDRLKLLYEQRDDLVESEENLLETIQKIDRIARKQFKETFDLVKANFEKLFALFFEGGTASLSLAGDPDPLEADIVIRAQPPGKRNQSLRMLSAGEKALTAIALLFSIYQVKPSPYCILDEVDAPLDDINIHKFTRVLKMFSEETQFLVVTHNKLTMEAANYLYGVTMEQKGVSKLVSVKFDS